MKDEAFTDTVDMTMLSLAIDDGDSNGFDACMNEEAPQCCATSTGPASSPLYSGLLHGQPLDGRAISRIADLF